VRFGEILGHYSDGIPIMNNVNGLTAVNTLSLYLRGLVFSFEMGQWNSGLRYRKRDTVNIEGGNLTLFYDSLKGIEPSVFIPGTAISFGAHFHTARFGICYMLGRQWEDIIFKDVYFKDEHAVKSIIFDNDFWFHQVLLLLKIDVRSSFVPVVYAKIKQPVGITMKTGWLSFETGLEMKFYPLLKRNRKGNSR
jgi:hypothetical protein